MKNTIVQFVGFQTEIEPRNFLTQWESYSEQLSGKHGAIIFERHGAQPRYKYVAQHKWAGKEFRFLLMKGKTSEHLPATRVIQTGGYMPVQIECAPNIEKDEIKIMLFLSHEETDISFYTQLSSYRGLNIYEAYFENCIYGFILEYFVKEIHASELVQQVKMHARHFEIGMYKECLMLN